MMKRTVLTRARDLGPVNADGTKSDCASPVLLIRYVTAGVWFAAGLPGSATTGRL